MNIKSDKLNCYIEGIRIPITNFKIEYRRNTLPTALVSVAIGEAIVPKSWAMALVQVTYIAESKEHLLFDGVCFDIDIDEQSGFLGVNLISKWEILNLNSPVDYSSPKKYGIQNIEEGVVIWLGNEGSVEIATEQTEGGLLSNRYYFLREDSRDIFDMDPNDSDAQKLEYIINRTPFAERFARIFFDDIIMGNFILSKAHVDRLNLLSKVGSNTKRSLVLQDSLDDALIETLNYQIKIDPTRTNLEEEYRKDIGQLIEKGCQVPGNEPAVGNSTITQSNTFKNFVDLIANDPRKQYIDLQAYGARKEKQYCTPETANAILVAAEKVYNEFKDKLMIGDISKANPAGTGFIGTGWKPHNDHKFGTALDLCIPGATNSVRGDYNYNKAIRCLRLFFESGARWIAFQDFKRQSELSKLSGGVVKDIRGHQDHFHVEFG